MDIYRDYFSAESLTDSISKAPFIPSQMLPLFETRAIASTVLAIESIPENGALSMDEIPRGSPLPAFSLEKRKVVSFPLKTFGEQSAVFADEVLNMRTAGTAMAGEMIQARRDEVIARLRRIVDSKHEELRLKCIKSPNNDFGNAPASKGINLLSDATKTRAEIYSSIISPMETALGGTGFTDINVYCSDGAWNKLISNKAINDTYVYSQQVSAIRGDPRDSFNWGGVNWIRYRGVGEILATDTAIAIPTGVMGLLIQAFGPDDTIDSVGSGTIGAPYYLNAFLLERNKGWLIQIQTHCAMICTRPQVLLPLAFT